MPEQKVVITAECVCDLPKSYLREHNIDILYFFVETESGVFTDTDEITAENIIGYMQTGGKKSKSSAPNPETYRSVFEKNLEKYDELIHVAISSGVSLSCSNAQKAISEMGEKGKRVHILDSRHLSSGLGHLVIKAVEMAESGLPADKIISELEELRDRVSTTFIAKDVAFLYQNGRVNEKIKKICDKFNIHPVLTMKDGQLALKSVYIGQYDKAYMRYIRRELKNPDIIDKRRGFITSVGCSVKMLEGIKNEINSQCRFEELILTKASATISSNCGPYTFGILFIRNKN